MVGFTSYDQMISKMTVSGQQFNSAFSKQMNPTTAAIAGEWHSLARGGGSPPADAIFDVGTNLQFQSVFDITTNASSIQHGGNISGGDGSDYKVLVGGCANTAAATTVPGSLWLVDILAFYRVTTVTTTTAQNTVYTNTFTASSSSGLLLTYTNDWSNYQKVRFTTTGTLPTGLSLNTDYWLVRQSATTAKVATTYANAIAGTVVSYTDAGTGTHTLTCRLPRYSDGAGVQAFFMNPAAAALGAATPTLSLPSYTNSAGTASRVGPATAIGKTGGSNSLILYSGTGAGKMGPSIPLQSGDSGIQTIQQIQNSTSYVSNSYTVCQYYPIQRIPLNVLGQDTLLDFTTTFPSYPRIYDGAALYFLWKSSTTTPTNALFEGNLLFGWGN